MALPILTTMDDVRSAVKYLKNKPTGATLAEMKAALKSSVVDPRKMTAYQFWGFVVRDGDRIKLASRGWELARKPESESALMRNVIDSIVPYRSVLEWAHHQNLDGITNNDVAAHWNDHHKDSVGSSNENTIKDGAVCFFHLAQGAGLGKLTIGRKGQATRLTLNKEELRKDIEAGPSAPTVIEREEASISEGTAAEDQDVESLNVHVEPPPPAKLRAFIAHGRNMTIVEQVQTMLTLADIESEVAENEETPAMPVPEKVFNAMHRCTAGVVVVTVDESRRDDKGNFMLNENVLIEIGAAYVLYDRRLVLLWDKRMKVPSNLQGLYRCEFEGQELSWAAGMKLMKAFQSFKKV